MTVACYIYNRRWRRDGERRAYHGKRPERQTEKAHRQLSAGAVADRRRSRGGAAAERLNQMDPASRGLTGTPSGVTFWRAEQEDVEIPDEAAPKAPAPRAAGDVL